VVAGKSISGLLTCRKLSGFPAAIWRASADDMTSYGSSQIWAAKSGWGRKAGNGFMIAIKMSGEHTEQKVVAHAKTVYPLQPPLPDISCGSSLFSVEWGHEGNPKAETRNP